MLFRYAVNVDELVKVWIVYPALLDIVPPVPRCPPRYATNTTPEPPVAPAVLGPPLAPPPPPVLIVPDVPLMEAPPLPPPPLPPGPPAPAPPCTDPPPPPA